MFLYCQHPTHFLLLKLHFFQFSLIIIKSASSFSCFQLSVILTLFERRTRIQKRKKLHPHNTNKEFVRVRNKFERLRHFKMIRKIKFSLSLFLLSAFVLSFCVEKSAFSTTIVCASVFLFRCTSSNQLLALR